jgi:hypothetical protein
VIGDERKFLIALFTLKVKFDVQLGKPTNELAPEVLSYV